MSDGGKKTINLFFEKLIGQISRKVNEGEEIIFFFRPIKKKLVFSISWI